MSKVLIAEDEAALLEIYAELVAGLGHECLVAHDGQEAVDLARARRPDVLVTDYMLPGRTGLEVIRALREDPELARVPTILLSAGRPSEAARAEAWRFLKKPISPEQFEHAVTEALRTSTASAPSAEAEPKPDAELTVLREEMLSWVSHEIKSPLSSAMMGAQLAMRDLHAGTAQPQELEARIALIMRQLARMDELVTSILDAAQLHDGKLKLDLEEIRVATWLKEVVGFWRDLHPDHEIVLEDGGGLVVRGDKERLRQVLDNLISNAIKYGRPSKRVVVRHIDDDDAHLRIAVIDEGSGIPAEQLPTIFQRFHRVPGHGGRGHGLGLYIAAALARLHGGTITVESQVGVGSTFTLTIPRLDVDAQRGGA
jgi:two-component system, sensor histidine kinase and response regulator